MSQQITVKVHVAKGSHGRQRIEPGTAPPPPPEPEHVHRVARVLALAHKWDDLIKSGAVRDRVSLARLVGVSRARITQVMTLLWLAPEIQEAVLFGEVYDGVAERDLRATASSPAWLGQLQSRPERPTRARHRRLCEGSAHERREPFHAEDAPGRQVSGPRSNSC